MPPHLAAAADLSRAMLVRDWLARVRSSRAAAHARDFAVIVLVAFASRVALLVVGYSALGHQSDPATLSTVLCRFDCSWYLGIAEHGYTTTAASDQTGATNFGFFPLFPLLVRGVAASFSIDTLFAALIVSNLCLLGALLYVFRYALLIGASRTAALLAVTLLCVFPQSIAFSAPYTESLFMLLMAAAVFHYLREQFLAAAIAAALLSATRPTGVFFMIFALVAMLQARGWRALLTPWKEPQRYLPIVFAPLGLFVFLAYCLLSVDDAFAHSHTEFHGWGYQFMPPWRGLRLLLTFHGVPQAAALSSIAVFACAWLLLPRRRFAELAMCLAFILLVWSSLTIGSIFRYWLVLFPVWVEVARRLETRPLLLGCVFALLSIVSGGIMWSWTLHDGAGI